MERKKLRGSIKSGKIEETLTLMKEMSKGKKGKEDDKAKKVYIDRKVQKTARLKEPERMLKS